MPAEVFTNPLSSAIVSLKKEQKAKFDNTILLMRDYNEKFERENPHFSKYLLD